MGLSAVGRRLEVAPPRAWRLATRVTALVVALLVPLLVLVVASYAQLIGERRAAEVEAAETVATMLAAVVDAFARDIEGTALAAALSLGAREGPLDQAAVGPYLSALADSYPVLRAIFLTDPSGRVIAAQRGEGIGTDLSSRPYIAALRDGAESFWSSAVIGSQSGEITIAYARVVRGPSGAPRAFLVTAYYPPELADRLPELPPDSDVVFVDRRGFILHSTARPELPVARRDVARAPSVQAALAGERYRLDRATPLYSDEGRYGAVVPAPRLGWAIGFTRPIAPLEARLRQQFLQQAGGITLLLLIAAGALAWLVGRLTRPITALADAADAVARGQRPVVPVAAGDPDVARLAAGMGAMSAAVADREDTLLRQSARLAALADAALARDDFLAAASHDLKNPLTSVRGMSQALARRLKRGDPPGPDDLAAALEVIDSASRRMGAQIDTMLDVARLETGRPLDLRREETDVVALARAAVADYQGASERHRLRVESDRDALVGRWDRARLERVLANLLDNAIKYSPEGGDIVVGVGREEGPDGGWAVVAVADQGIGIPAESLASVFERFERGANVVGRIPGTGVGLSGARQIVEQHGGSIDVCSREGAGSVFTVRLPLEGGSDGAGG